MEKIRRFISYLLAGVIFAYIGYFLGQILLYGLPLRQFLSPEPVALATVAPSLAFGLFFTEIAVRSDPKKPKRFRQNLKRAKKSLLIALILGLISGIILGLVYLWVTTTSFEDATLRMINWLLVGLAVSLAEVGAWYELSIDVKELSRFFERLGISVIFSLLATFFAFSIFEGLRGKGDISNLKTFEDPIGYVILGVFLCLALGFLTSPSYLPALRAGAGFENIGKPTDKGKIVQLSFVGKFQDKGDDFIDEGLSIKLKISGKNRFTSQEILIGSSDNCHLKLKNAPDVLATLIVTRKETTLKANRDSFDKVYHNGRQLTDTLPQILQDNDILTFYCDDAKTDFYRFAYYNRFWDPFS